MTVKVVTDSCADLTREQVESLGITVIPLHVRFGDIGYRDGVDLSIDEFYSKLGGPAHPNTAAPAPGEFARTYEKLFTETDGIVSIHVTRKHSAVMQSATIGSDIVSNKDRRVEVIDSRGVTMWQGLVAMAAAESAKAGASLGQVISRANEVINNIHGLGVLESLKYVIRGGRLGGALAKVESVLNVKSLITCKDGHIKPAGLVRSKGQGVERLLSFIKNVPRIERIAVVYNTNPEDAYDFAGKIASLFPAIVPLMSRLGPTVGSHAGPGALIAVVQQSAAA